MSVSTLCAYRHIVMLLVLVYNKIIAVLNCMIIHVIYLYSYCCYECYKC